MLHRYQFIIQKVPFFHGETLPLPCVFTAFAAKTPPEPCAFPCLRGQDIAFALRFHRLRG